MDPAEQDTIDNNNNSDDDNNNNGGVVVRTTSASRRIRPVDILCSTEPRHASHRGNQDYAVSVSAFLLRHPHVDLESLAERVAASREIVQISRARDARFLAKTRRGTWKDVGDELAVRWVSLHFSRMAQHLAAEGGPEEQEHGIA